MFNDFFPTDEELNLIVERLNIPLRPTKESGISLRVRAADDQIDRGKDQFQLKALDTMGKLAVENRIPFLQAAPSADKDHKWLSVNTLGHVYDYYVENGNLVYKIYMALAADKLTTLENIVKGNYDKVSVGFAIAPEDYMCSVCNIPIVDNTCPHMPEDEGVFTKINDVSDNFELSLVAVPMQPRARVLGKGVIMSEENKELAAAVEQEAVKEVVPEQVVAKEEAPTKEDPLLAAIKSFQNQLSNIEEKVNAVEPSLVEKMENALKNITIDKISSDVTKDTPMEQVVETAESVVNPPVVEETTKEETAETKDMSIEDCMKCMKDLHDKVDNLHSKMDGLMSYVLGTGQKAATEVETKEEVAAAADPIVETEKSVEQEVKRSTKSLEERVQEQTVTKKSIDELLWERLTAKE